MTWSDGSFGLLFTKLNNFRLRTSDFGLRTSGFSRKIKNMLLNYFKVAWRNINKHRFYSSVNIIGLSMGILFSFLIGGYVWDQLRVNKNLRNADRQYYL